MLSLFQAEKTLSLSFQLWAWSWRWSIRELSNRLNVKSGSAGSSYPSLLTASLRDLYYAIRWRAINSEINVAKRMRREKTITHFPTLIGGFMHNEDGSVGHNRDFNQGWQRCAKPLRFSGHFTALTLFDQSHLLWPYTVKQLFQSRRTSQCP